MKKQEPNASRYANNNGPTMIHEDRTTENGYRSTQNNQGDNQKCKEGNHEDRKPVKLTS